jgi:hypothetical protein
LAKSRHWWTCFPCSSCPSLAQLPSALLSEVSYLASLLALAKLLSLAKLPSQLSHHPLLNHLLGEVVIFSENSLLQQ